MTRAVRRGGAPPWLALLLAAAPGILLAASPAAEAPAAKVHIRALDGLRFDLPRFRVEPGEKVRLVFENRDGSGMQHNLLIVRPGAREEVVRMALELGPRGGELGYVPPTDLVLRSTPVLGQDGMVTLEFEAPATPGVYPYVCTFPGHGFVMYGAMYVGQEMPGLAADPNVPDVVRNRAGAGAEAPEPVVRPKVLRYLMPEVGPAAIAVALPGDQNYVWDAGAVRLRYAWSGDFVDRSESLQGLDGKMMQLPAEVLGTVYYRAKSAYPIRIGDTVGTPVVRFRGYRVIGGIPEFHYTVDGVEVRELIRAAPRGDGLTRTFTIEETRLPVFFVREPGTGVRFDASAGSWNGDVLRIGKAQARRFSVTMSPTR